MSMAFDGLSSGLDTTAIVNSTIALARKPAVALEAKVKSNSSVKTIWNDLKLNVNSLKTAATSLRSIGGNFMPVSASASNESVKATATSSAQAGEITFRVDQAASKHVAVTKGSFERDTAVTSSDSSISFTVNGENKTVNVAAGTTLEDLASDINKADIGVNASLINTGQGYKLQLSSKDSGAESAFTADISSLTGLQGTGAQADSNTLQVLSQGQDAKVTIGAGSAAEFSATSKTNTFDNVLKGVSFTIGQETVGKTVTVKAEADHSKLADKVNTLVGAVNTILSAIDDKSKGVSKYDEKGNQTDKAGVLKGNALAREIRNGLVNTLTRGNTLDGNPVSLTEFGIEIQKDGTFKFDASKFKDAVKDRPEVVEKLFIGDGSGEDKTSLTARVRSFADNLTDSTDGLLSKAVESIDSQNKQYKGQIETIDDRLESRRAAMIKQFATFETQLGKLKQQQGWLLGQLSSLNSAR